MSAVGHITTGDAERLLDFVAAGGDEPFDEETLVEIGQLVDADWVGYSELDWEERRAVGGISPPGSGPYDSVDWVNMEQHFWADIAAVHPIRRAARSGFVGALRISDLFASRRQLRRSRIYNDWMRLCGAEHMLDLTLRTDAGICATFHFDRLDGRDFSERDRTVLDLVGPHLARRREADRISRLDANASEPQLTPREREVLTHVARGLTNAEVAELLWVAPSTVRKHLENVYEKLGVSTRTAAAARFLGRLDVESS